MVDLTKVFDSCRTRRSGIDRGKSLHTTAISIVQRRDFFGKGDYKTERIPDISFRAQLCKVSISIIALALQRVRGRGREKFSTAYPAIH